ncbi:thiol:disulfide interchange protein DsbA/DsbL [Zymobacter sp. IVIA_5232.4 C2]|uniref:thiol:disulfide interchange protein DsbA/DsbL n=1 Tax=Zymobacter sp. IVIA_5232.4 C2 TaxID=3394855 RepID=UPI0039C14D33
MQETHCIIAPDNVNDTASGHRLEHRQAVSFMNPHEKGRVDTMIKKLMTLICGVGLAFMALTAQASDYKTLDTPVDVQVPAGKIKVEEIFWYGCPHCYEFEPTFTKWVAEQKDDVVVDRMPAPLGRLWATHARAYYAAKALGIYDKVHEPFFNAVQQRQPLNDDEHIAEFFSHYGVSKDDALKALQSFGVKSQINIASSALRSYGLMGVPAIVINGKYVINMDGSTSVTTPEGMLTVADQLIDQLRREAHTGK